MTVKMVLVLYALFMVAALSLYYLFIYRKEVFGWLQCRAGHHQWLGCKCQRCGAQRDTNHSFRIEQNSNNARRWAVCSICGAVCQHTSIVNCRCTRCGLEFHNYRTDDEWWDDKRMMYKWRGTCINCGHKSYR